MGSVQGLPRHAQAVWRVEGIRSRAVAVLLVAGVIVSAAGCSGSGGTSTINAAPASSPSGSVSASATLPSTSGSTAVPSASSSQAVQAGQDALATYRAAFVDWQTAGATSDYQSPVLAQHMSGTALSYVTQSMYLNRTKGAVTKGAPVLNPTVGQLVPATAPAQVVINDCIHENAWLRYTTDGHLFDNVPGGNHKSQALVKYANGAWKVDQLLMQPVGTC